MKAYTDMTQDELRALHSDLKAQYKDWQDKGLDLNMARGKPGKDQLDLSMGLLDVVTSQDDMVLEDGTDLRNYGVLDGLPAAKDLMAGMMNVKSDQVIIYGNSSLNVMYDQIARSMTHGVNGSKPWAKLDTVKWLCPSPGYDRHFGITEWFGIEMITIPMTPEGPDMDMVEKLVAEDEAIKGMWCVPMYSNPQGVVYSDETVRRIAALNPKAGDFRVYWDNAYCIHHLYDEHPTLLNILDECEKAGHPDMAMMFASTSKVVFPGAGISALATSKTNKDFILRQLTNQTIGYDKINQYRHVKFFKNVDGLKAHMKKHADIIRPKFEAVEHILEEELGGLEIGTWLNPRGGYFIHFDTLPGCAKRTVELAKDAGVVMTGAGATFPYHNDPQDTSIRIAPTLPSADEMAQAARLFALCVKLAACEKLIA